MDTKELLNRTVQCSKCGGTGLVENKESTAAQEMCDVCAGTGIVLDSFITDLMIENGIKGSAMVKFAEEVFKHYEEKLQDSYNRGIEDGKAEGETGDSKTNRLPAGKWHGKI